MSRLGSISPEDAAKRARNASHLDLNCPPLPHTLFEAMRLMENPGQADLKRVVQMAQNDPLVAGRLLKVVNSPFYGFSSPVADVGRAVRLLGPRGVCEIVMGMNVIRLQATMDGPAGPTFSRLTRHSLAVADFGAWLWGQVDPKSESQGAFAAGLFHDFGKLVLIYNYPKQAADLYSETESRTEKEWLAAEHARFGCSSKEAGHHVAEMMDLTPDLVKQLRRPDSEPASLVIRGADLVARATGFWFTQPLDWETCIADPLWQALAAAYPAEAGDVQELLEEAQSRTDRVERYIGQLLRRRADRDAASSIKAKPRPRRDSSGWHRRPSG